jgi:hypothetical protein
MEVKLSNARSVFVRKRKGRYEIALPDHGHEGFYVRHTRDVWPDELQALAECIAKIKEE